ncbi:hypothetical protein C8Q72DRAFT_251888 [Fomitopsis betulina]|nr:hypothetical protein C8Q72DRAFT_251888 [Fomitopsis betulina]
MFHPLPLPRVHLRKHPRPEPCPASSPRATDRPSSPVRRGLRFPVPTTKKAPPTLSLSNTNVSRSGTTPVAFPNDVPEEPSHSIIPFPSAPIDFPVRRTDRQEDPDVCSAPDRLDGDGPVENKAEIRRDIDWRRIRRRCTESCTVGSFPSELPKTAPAPPSKEEPSRRPFAAFLINVPAEPDSSSLEPKAEAPTSRVRRHSVSAGCGPYRPVARRVRKVKKVAMDVQFIAVAHRSIALHARVTREHGGLGKLNACVEQDVELATRLWKILAKKGCRPAPLDPIAPATPTLDENIARADPVSRSVDDSSMTGPVDAQSIPLVIEQPVPSSAPSVLTMPQLVASMTLRFRDRTTMRPRSTVSLPETGRESLGRPPRPRSALGHVVFSSGDGEEDAVAE